MSHVKRRKLYIDPTVQRMLILRVVFYWVACMATLELWRFTWQTATGPEQPSFLAYFFNYDWLVVGRRLTIAAILLAPIAWDMLKFTNRFAGPVFNIRRVLRKIAQGGPVDQVRLRRGDYWHGLADDLNAALQKLAPAQENVEPFAVAHEPAEEDEQDEEADAKWQVEDLTPVGEAEELAPAC